MGKKDRQSMEELWSKRFDEEAEQTDEQPLSRKAKREREKSISPILTVTLIFMALLIILPTSAYIWWSSREGMSEDPSGPAVEQVAENNESEETEELIEEEPEEPENQESKTGESDEEEMDEDIENEEMSESVTENDTESNDSVVSENPSNESDVPASDDPENQETDANDSQSTDTTPVTEEEQPTETVPPQNADYYTVKAGDNMYRIALNHGMTTEELMQLNNIQDETVYVGQELRVE